MSLQSPMAAPPAPAAPPRGERKLVLMLFLGAHMPLALVMFGVPMVASVHAIITVIVGVWMALRGRLVIHVAYVGAYIVGAEVLWRMARAPIIFWEYGKYATVLILILALVRLGPLKAPSLPILYFVLLIPSAILTVMNETLAEARQQISFNLSGPLALMVSAWFFSRLRISAAQLQRMFFMLIGPVLGIGAFTLFATLTNPDIVFTGESNRDVVGGFGPNQVSATLGLGALLALFCVINDKEKKWVRALMFGAVVFFTALAALTFSRGGLYNAAGAAAFAFFYLMKDSRARLKFVAAAALFFVVANFIIFPQLDAYTGGALEARFQNVDPTGRTEIFFADLRIWEENPILGVGPGQAMALREELMLAAHTEFSRLFSEHGIFGFAALLLLLFAGLQNIRQARTIKGKALSASMVGWSFLFMLNAAMRTVAPSFTFGLAAATIRPEDNRVAAPVAPNQEYRSAPSSPIAPQWQQG